MATPDTCALPGLRRPQKRAINQLAADLVALEFHRVRDRLLRELASEAAAGADIDALIAQRRLALLRSQTEAGA